MSGAVLVDAATLLHAFGPWVLLGIGIVVFIESGVLFPFLPGDSLLVSAAVLGAGLGVSWWQVALVGTVAAVCGDQVGFFIGRRWGRRWFRPRARVLRTDRLAAAEAFFARYGALSLVLGRFVPVVRTYVPLAAGTAGMSYRRFARWNVVGAVAWSVGMSGIGALLGGVPVVADHIDVLMVLVVGVSVLPVVIGALTARARRRRGDGDTAVADHDTDADPDRSTGVDTGAVAATDGRPADPSQDHPASRTNSSAT